MFKRFQILIYVSIKAFKQSINSFTTLFISINFIIQAETIPIKSFISIIATQLIDNALIISAIKINISIVESLNQFIFRRSFRLLI